MPQKIEEHRRQVEIKHRRQKRKQFFLEDLINVGPSLRLIKISLKNPPRGFYIFTFYSVLLTKPTDLDSGFVSCCP